MVVWGYPHKQRLSLSLSLSLSLFSFNVVISQNKSKGQCVAAGMARAIPVPGNYTAHTCKLGGYH